MYEQVNKEYREGKIELTIPPISISLELSQKCNLNCVMCEQRLDPKLELFPVSILENIIKDLTWNNIARLSLIGGEPFFTEDGIALFEYISKNNPPDTITYTVTNGTLLHKHIENLKKIDNLMLLVSVDGFGKSYEKVRKTKWNHLMKNLMLLKEAKKEKPKWQLLIMSLIMKSTISSLLDLVKLAELIDASAAFTPVVGQFKEENVFLYPELLNGLNWEEDVNKAIEYAERIEHTSAIQSLQIIMKELQKVSKEDRTTQFSMPEKKPSKENTHLIERLDNIKDNIAGGGCVVYGAGGHTELLLKKGILSEFKILVIADSDKSKWGRSLCGLNIISPKEILKYSNDIIISSAFEEEIKRYLTQMYGNSVNIYTLYS